MLILEITAGVFLGLVLYEWLVGSKLRAAQRDEDDAIEMSRRELSREPLPNPPNKYTGHAHGCLCKLCVSVADIDHEDRKIQLQAEMQKQKA